MYKNTEHMQHALRLAKRGFYTTAPNPRVGCVIVKNDKVVGEGWHVRSGEAHAEIIALQQAGSHAKNATVYVTLEPCSHTGKTPPCADALIKAGIRKIIAAMVDPNPLVAGKGLDQLREQGVEVSSGLLEAQARMLNPGFVKRMEQGRPYVRVKMAMSMDGRTAMESGESQWVTGEAARTDVQHLRAKSSAVLTGIGTVLADDPSMNVRLSTEELGIQGEIRQPLRIVLDTKLRISPEAKIFNSEGQVLVITSEAEKAGHLPCKVQQVSTLNGVLNLDEVMTVLAEQEINELHVEAGAVLSGALVQQKLVDELVLYIAPHLLGDSAKGLFALPGLSQMKQRIELDIQDVRSIGKDLRITARPVYS